MLLHSRQQGLEGLLPCFQPCQHAQDTFLAQTFTRTVGCLGEPVGHHHQPVARCSIQHRHGCRELIRLLYSQRQVPGRNGDTVAPGTQQPAIRQATVPDTQTVVFEIRLNHQAAAKHANWQYSSKLAVDFPENIRGSETFGRHPIEDFRHGHGTNGGWQSVPGEITEEHQGAPAGALSRKQDITVEDRQG